MRVLLTTRAYIGHFRPMLPLARSLMVDGHEVAVASGELIRREAAHAGIRFYPAGPDQHTDAGRAAMFPESVGLHPDRIRPFFFGAIFTAYELPLRAKDLYRVVDEFRPDVLVCEVAEFAGPLVATLRGLPYATHSFGPVLVPDGVRAAAEGAAAHWNEAGLEPHPRAGLWEYLYVDVCPPSLQGAEPEGAPSSVAVRPVEVPNRAATERRDPPLVYVTLGTVYNSDLSVFDGILGGLGGLDVEVVVTVGRSNDPQALGPQPANVRVEQFIPQDELLPDCSLMITHGGAGSTIGALAHGCPLLLVPQGADQFTNAGRVAAAGAGIELRPDAFSASAVRAAAQRLLGENTFPAAAARIAGEIAAMPDPSVAAAAVVGLAGRPVSSTPGR